MFNVRQAAETTRNTATATASALAELAVVCDEIAARAGPPRDQRYLELAARFREGSQRYAAFVVWEDTEIRRLFGEHPAPP